MKEIIDKLNFIRKLYERHCQENEKTSHRLGEIFAKDISDKRL